MSQELLGALEERWHTMVRIITDLRQRNQSLRGQLQEREDRIARMTEESAKIDREVEALREEKKRTIATIEGLLAHFDELEGEPQQEP